MDYELNDVREFLVDFFSSMNAWEYKLIEKWKSIGGDPSAVGSMYIGELSEVFEKYVSKKPRKRGRLDNLTFSLGSPEYDPGIEKISGIEKVGKGFSVETEKTYPNDGYTEKYRYKIIVDTEALKIDVREIFVESKQKWESHQI